MCASRFLTEVVQAVAGSVESACIELQADNSKDYNGKEEEKGDVGQRADGLCDGAHYHLQTCNVLHIGITELVHQKKIRGEGITIIISVIHKSDHCSILVDLSGLLYNDMP